MTNEISAAEYRAMLASGKGAATADRPKVLDTLEAWLYHGNFGRVEQEVRFHPERQWRADYLLPDQSPPVIIEYDGLMRHGRNQGHASISGILRDTEKHNAAQALGFRVFRTNAKHVDDGSFFALLADVLEEIA